MTTSLLISIHHEHSELIYSGHKKLEIRKTCPFRTIKEKMPVKVFMYETKAKCGCGMITGYFICDCFLKTEPLAFLNGSCLTESQLLDYAKGKLLTAFHVKESIKFLKPIPLSSLGISRPPQSWCYIKNNKSEEF